MKGTIFCPNLGCGDYVRLFSESDGRSWADVRAQLAGFKMYRDNVLCDDRASVECGVNTCQALTDAGVFRTVASWFPVVLMEAAASKAQDPTAETNTAATLAALERVRQAGGRVDLVAMDEPLCSTLRGLFERDKGQLTDPNAVGDLARHTAEYVGALRRAGVGVGLIEAYPYHPAERLEGFIRDIVETNGQPLDFLEIDLDPYAVSDHKIKLKDVTAGLSQLAAVCQRYRMDFRAIVTAQRPHDDASYATEALAHFANLQRLARFDGYTVQSWHESDTDHTRRIPANFPTHLDIVRQVLAAQRGAAGEVQPAR